MSELAANHEEHMNEYEHTLTTTQTTLKERKHIRVIRVIMVIISGLLRLSELR